MTIRVVIQAIILRNCIMCRQPSPTQTDNNNNAILLEETKKENGTASHKMFYLILKKGYQYQFFIFP